MFYLTRYDVWLVDWRTSCNLPSMARRDYTLDDCAAYDYPAAINKVIEVTKQVRFHSVVKRFEIFDFNITCKRNDVMTSLTTRPRS